MDWIKYWLQYPLAILTLTAIIIITGIDEFLVKLRNRLTLSATESHTGGKNFH